MQLADGDDLRDGAGVAQFLRVIGELGAVDEEAHAAVADDAFELVNGGAGRERDDDHPVLSGGEEDVEELGTVAGEEADAVALRDGKTVAKGRGRGESARVELAVGEAERAVRHRERLAFGRQSRALSEQVTVEHCGASFGVRRQRRRFVSRFDPHIELQG